MRFLLQPSAQRSTSQGLRQGRVAKKAKSNAFPQGLTVTSKVASSTTDKNYVQSWGQQCSPNCGCVVRFETRVDPSTNKFISASYSAKSVVVTPTKAEDKQGQLQPVMTFRNNRPMLTSCSCESLHKLSSQITKYLPDKDVLSFRSSLEFSGIRASPAFRHSVLEKQGLPTSNTHCFDVVEEALTAMIKGHMPKPRQQITPKEIYAKSVSSTNIKERGSADVDEYTIDMSSFFKPPRAVSAIQMMDVTAKYSPFGFSDRHEDDSHYSAKTSSNETAKTRPYDWVSYVDELYYKERSA